MTRGLRPPPPPKPPPGPPAHPPACRPVQAIRDGVVVPNPIVNTLKPRTAADSAAVAGSTPWVFAPSVSTMITSAAYPDRWADSASTPVGATVGLIAAMLSIE